MGARRARQPDAGAWPTQQGRKEPGMAHLRPGPPGTVWQSAPASSACTSSSSSSVASSSTSSSSGSACSQSKGRVHSATGQHPTRCRGRRRQPGSRGAEIKATAFGITCGLLRRTEGPEAPPPACCHPPPVARSSGRAAGAWPRRWAGASILANWPRGTGLHRREAGSPTALTAAQAAILACLRIPDRRVTLQ